MLKHRKASRTVKFCFLSHTEGPGGGPGAGVGAAGGQGQCELQPGGQPPRPQPHMVSTQCVLSWKY